MKLASLFSLTAFAACTGTGGHTAHVVLQALPSWTGTAEVMVHAPAGSLVSRAALTGDTDVAITEGDTVSVVLHDGSNIAVTSDLDVSEGDTVHFLAEALSSSTTANVSVSVPGVSGATGWYVSGLDARAVASATTPVQIAVPAGMTATPVIAEAYDDSGPLAVYGSASAPIASFAIDLSASVPFQATTITPINGASDAGAFASTFVGYDWLGLEPQAGIYAVPKALGDKVELGASDGTDSIRVAAATFDPADVPASYSPDLSLKALPSVAPIAISGTTLTWTDDAGTAYDAAQGGLNSSTAPGFVWIFSARPGSGSATMPELPADLGAPATFDSAWAQAYDRSTIDGYDALIATDGVTKPGDTWGEIYVNALKGTGGGPLAPPTGGHGVSRR